MSSDRGGDAVTMLYAVLAGETFPPAGVAGTAANRVVWDGITADIAAMPAGVVPDIPADWTDMPDEPVT